MVGSRGTWAWADVLYWFFYIPFTTIVMIALVMIPSSIIEESLQPTALDAVQMKEMLFQRVSDYEYPYGTMYHADFIEMGDETSLSLSRKRFGYKLTVINQDSGNVTDYYGNEDFYYTGMPLAPVRYDRFAESRQFEKDGVPYTVIVDVVFPKEYGILE